jgi:hypothetical protein
MTKNLLYQGPNTGTTTAPTYTYPIFDTFWNNEGLRATLFTRPPALTNDDDYLAFGKTKFIEFVNNNGSILYAFISIK